MSSPKTPPTNNTKDDDEKIDMLFTRYAYFTQEPITFKSKDPNEAENVCNQELNAFTHCELMHKQNAAEECEGFREAFIQCQRDYNQREKTNEERVKMMAQKLYFLQDGETFVQENVPSSYDVEQMKNRRF